MLKAAFLYALCGVSLVIPEGQRRARISGIDSFAGGDYFPWLVSVETHYRLLTAELCSEINSVCAGSLIDIYGTVLTNSQCVAPNKAGGRRTSVEGIYTISGLTITWGSFVRPPRTEYMNVSAVNNRIIMYDGAFVMHKDPSKTDYAFALIFLQTYEQDPIDCNQRPVKVRPVKLGKYPGLGEDKVPPPCDGIVTSYGSDYFSRHSEGEDYKEQMNRLYRRYHYVKLFYFLPSYSTRFEVYAADGLSTSSGFLVRTEWRKGYEAFDLTEEDYGAPFVYKFKSEDNRTVLADNYRLVGIVRLIDFQYDLTDDLQVPLHEILHIHYASRFIEDVLTVRYHQRGVRRRAPATC